MLVSDIITGLFDSVQKANVASNQLHSANRLKLAIPIAKQVKALHQLTIYFFDPPSTFFYSHLKEKRHMLLMTTSSVR